METNGWVCIFSILPVPWRARWDHGACKHVAASSLHDCLHPSTGPTDDLCYWKNRTTKSTRPAPITEVKIGKTSNSMKKRGFKSLERKRNVNKKLPDVEASSKKQRKTRGPYKNELNFDPRPPRDQGSPS